MEGYARKVAVVTGAGSGIGHALAIELGRSGANAGIAFTGDVEATSYKDFERVLDVVVRITGSGYQRLFSTALSRILPY